MWKWYNIKCLLIILFMDKNQNHWIALYLSGQYPWYYTMPDRLNFFDELKLENSVRYNDTILWQYQGKNDVEFFYSLLNSFQRNHLENYESFLERIWIPDNVKNDPRKERSIKSNNLDLEEFEKYLDWLDEEWFSRYIIMPILQAMWYENIEFKWKVNETDFWLDFYPVKYISPGWVTHYCWVQTKSKKMTVWDTTWTELNKLIEETKTAFWQKHNLNTWEQIKISEYLVFNSKEILQSARDKYFKDENIENKKIKLYWKDWILSLVNQFNLKIK